VSSAYLCKTAMMQGCSAGCQDGYWQLLAYCYAIAMVASTNGCLCSGCLLMHLVSYAVACVLKKLKEAVPNLCL